MIPVMTQEDLEAAIEKDGAVIGIVNSIEITAPIMVALGQSVTVTAFDRGVTLSTAPSFDANAIFEITIGELTLGDRRGVGVLTLEGKLDGSRTSSLVSVGLYGPGQSSIIMNDRVTIKNNSYLTGDGGGVFVIGSNASFTMNGGTICNNKANSSGGGVYIVGGSFTMKGGFIRGNNAVEGGGVSITGDGTFTMTGGTISGNKASNAAGVYISNSTLNITGGAIEINIADADGGGVYLAGTCPFFMNGGVIRGNTAKDGGGVHVFGGSFTMDNGTISGNIVNNCGGGIYVRSSVAFTMNGGAITGNTAGNSGGGVYAELMAIIIIPVFDRVTGNHAPPGTENNFDPPYP